MLISQWSLLVFVTRNSVGLIHVGSVKPENTGLMPWAESAPTRLAANSEYKTPEDLLGQWLVGRYPREGDCNVPARQLGVLGETPDCRDGCGQGQDEE